MIIVIPQFLPWKERWEEHLQPPPWPWSRTSTPSVSQSSSPPAPPPRQPCPSTRTPSPGTRTRRWCHRRWTRRQRGSWLGWHQICLPWNNHIDRFVESQEVAEQSHIVPGHIHSCSEFRGLDAESCRISICKAMRGPHVQNLGNKKTPFMIQSCNQWCGYLLLSVPSGVEFDKKTAFWFLGLGWIRQKWLKLFFCTFLLVG